MAAGRPLNPDIATGVVSVKGAAVYFNRLKRHVPEATEAALLAVASQLLEDSKAYVPVLTGALKKSAKVQYAISMSTAIRAAEVVYGSADVVYAAIQHDGDFNHPSLGFKGPAKYLERPLRTNYLYYMELLRRVYEETLLKKMEKYND